MHLSDRQKAILIGLAFSLFMTWFLPYNQQVKNRKLFDLPISISPAGSVKTEFDIRNSSVNYLDFTFEREGHTNDELRKAIGETRFFGRDKYADSDIQGHPYANNYYRNIAESEKRKTGVPIIVHWELSSIPKVGWEASPNQSKKIICKGEVETAGVDGWRPKYVERSIPYFCTYVLEYGFIPAGRFEFTATIVKDVPELSSYKTRIRLSPRFDEDSFIIGQMGWFVFIFLDIVLGIALLISMGRRLFNNRKKENVNQ